MLLDGRTARLRHSGRVKRGRDGYRNRAKDVQSAIARFAPFYQRELRTVVPFAGTLIVWAGGRRVWRLRRAARAMLMMPAMLLPVRPPLDERRSAATAARRELAHRAAADGRPKHGGGHQIGGEAKAEHIGEFRRLVTNVFSVTSLLSARSAENSRSNLPDLYGRSGKLRVMCVRGIPRLRSCASGSGGRGWAGAYCA